MELIIKQHYRGAWWTFQCLYISRLHFLVHENTETERVGHNAAVDAEEASSNGRQERRGLEG